MIPEFRRPFEVLLVHGLPHLQAQGVELPGPGDLVLFPLLQEAVLGLGRLRLCLGGGPQGGHVGEEIVKGVFQHTAHGPQERGIGGEEVLEEAAAEETPHHALGLGGQLLGVAQLFGAVGAEALLGDAPVDVALVNEGNLILTTILTFHNRNLL